MSEERDLKWKQVASNYVYNDRWFKARADKCEFPDGRIIEPYYVVELPDWCNTIVITADEKIVLVRQYRYPINQVTYELPGGIMEKGETPILAAKREMEEETGYSSHQIQFLMKLSPNPAINDNTAYFFLALNAQPIGKTNFDQFEDIDVVLFSKKEMLDLLAENKIQHGVQVGPIYQALLQLGWLNN